MTRLLTEEHGHFYVCGDCKMADDVEQTLEEIIQKHGNMTEEEAKEFVAVLRVGYDPFFLYSYLFTVPLKRPC